MKEFIPVGINHFAIHGNDLSGCVPDANTMESIGEGLGTIKTSPILDLKAVKKAFFDRGNISLANALAGKLTYLGISWSGHGTHYNRPEESDGLGEALCCANIAQLGDDWDPATIIKDTELRDFLNKFPMTCLVELWLDTCFSGGMDRALSVANTRSNRFLHNPGNFDKLMRVASPNATMNVGLNSNIIMWCASSEAQESADAFIGGGAHGAFTWYWVNRFKANPKATRTQILVDTRKGLSAAGYDQMPRLKCWPVPAQRQVGK